jgi:hypothetical protein
VCRVVIFETPKGDLSLFLAILHTLLQLQQLEVGRAIPSDLMQQNQRISATDHMCLDIKA